MSDDYWVLARTEPSRERKAKEAVEQQGFEAYLPCYQGKNRTLPLFPRYLFVHVRGRWRPLRSTWYITSLILRSENEPARIPQHVIDEIRANEADGIVQLPPPPEPKKRRAFDRGELVRVNQGPFTGFVGIYDGMTTRGRERVLLSLFGRPSPVFYKPEAIEEIKKDDYL